jgi:hypothetical protein
MKLETKIIAAGLLSEIREYVAREIGELRGRTADASRVAELVARVQELETRIAALERERAGKASRVVRVA